MSALRILAIMGSGETAPTMAKVHRALLDRFSEPATVAIVDTPYGFQENADDLSARTVEFFETSVGRPTVVASYRSRDVDAFALSTAVSRIREAGYVMAGPGSPSYALRQWTDGPIPAALRAKLENGGVLTMASAAALTLGVATIPVYEIYKVGQDPHWLDGLDLLGPATGLRAAVVPHYDNAEGGNHDTRFCYMGERRLAELEAQLPVGTSILGVDSHTALILDLDTGSATVAGLGGVTVRVAGQSARIASGTQLPIAALADAARGLAEGRSVATVELDAARSRPVGGASSRPRPEPLPDEMRRLEGAFVASLDQRDIRASVAALLELDEAITARIRAGEDSPDLDNARATFRSLIVRLGDRASSPEEDVGSLDLLAGALTSLRDEARARHDWPTADAIRARLSDAGFEVHDAVGSSSWTRTPGATT